jgi:hypothetical protein
LPGEGTVEWQRKTHFEWEPSISETIVLHYTC